MDVKELRIGNYLLYIENIVKLTGVNDDPCVTFQPFDNGLYFGSNPNDFSPIRLTKEWIDNFGFSSVENYSKGCYGNGKCSIWHFEGETYMANVKLNYVHQLQNLYYASYFEELELKK